MAKARDPPGRVLDHPGRRVEPGPDLFPEMGVAGRARGENGQVRRRSRMAEGARRNRERRPDRRLDYQLVPDADLVLVGEVAATKPVIVMVRLDPAVHARPDLDAPGERPDVVEMNGAF